MLEASVTRKGAASGPGWLRAGWQGPRQWAGRAKKRLLWSLKSSPFLRGLKDRRNTSLARFKRSRLGDVTFIGVTGSCAKTTTCILTKAILLPGDRWQEGSHQNVAEAILRIDPADKHHVQEMSAEAPGKLAPNLSLMQPHVGIVTVIGEDHYKNYRSREAVAQEKGLLIAGLPKTGVAVLNADDPHVLAMASRTVARVVTYGLSPKADIRAAKVSGTWPDALALTVQHGGESVVIQTRFVGEHWATCVLAAVACGIACGVDLRSCAAAIEKVDPLFGRYSVHRTPGGTSYVLDMKASHWTIASGLDFVKKAKAPRKTIIFGNISDYPGPASRRYRQVARGALEVADRVAFVGSHSAYVDKVRRQVGEGRLFTFMTSFQASAFLAETAVAGELIYVKFSARGDHLERLMLAELDQVVCWRERCGVKGSCTKCLYYRKPEPPPLGVSHEESGAELETA